MNYKLFFFNALFFFFFSSTNAQKNIFIRVYNSQNIKIGKGNLLLSTDSTIEMMQGSKQFSLSVKDAAVIKTRHSAGHSILIGSATGTGIGLILIAGAAATDNKSHTGLGPDAGSFGLALVGVAAPVVGIIGGGVAAVVGKRETFQINGDAEKWKEVRSKLLNIL